MIYNGKPKLQKFFLDGHFSLCADWGTHEHNETGFAAWLRHDTGIWINWPMVTGICLSCWRWYFSFAFCEHVDLLPPSG
jgi:hypothetical protein